MAFYITVCCIAFVASKVKRRIIEEGFSGGKLVLFRSLTTAQALPSRAFLKKTMRLTSKDIIGSGGYGTVYKLVIDGGAAAFAGPRLRAGAGGMGDIKHRNILTLHGYYTTPQFNLLIYELMPNGSLDALLHGKEKKALDWATRHKIAVGTARGLSYLHHDCQHPPRREHGGEGSGLRLATLVAPSQTHASTVVAGTFGYLAPEYFETGRATTKGDVYSFGVVLLELLTGRKPTDESFVEEGTGLVSWVKEVANSKCIDHAVDGSLVCYPLEETISMFCIAERCLETDPSKRPSMSEVLKMLEQMNSEDYALKVVDQEFIRDPQV
ncbi:unnamed protein product [Spirodela intermedia]|uniref:Protein kinase domain-containing protein n=1 Tax=Spirodela intermedia TaxID=51605 RepID=A0A7I8J526_SPIIN|nr:unnamed protein product [Spirodela intermedia]CAA6665348.1 unnamed protein product [Spirodela intermedia]